MFISCHYKVEKVIDAEEKDNVPDASFDTINVFKLIEAEGTIVEKIDRDDIVSCKALCIDVKCLQLNLLGEGRCFVAAEIFNNTNDTIYRSNDTFLYYDEENKHWSVLPYPVNFVREDLGKLVPPNTKQYDKFFFPIRDKIMQGKYKLQLSFYTKEGKFHYYVSKIFVIK